MRQIMVLARRPLSPASALSSDLSDWIRVVVLPGGRIVYGMPGHSDLYNNDPVFLHAIIEALRGEMVRLEDEVDRLRRSRSRTTARRRPAPRTR